MGSVASLLCEFETCFPAESVNIELSYTKCYCRDLQSNEIHRLFNLWDFSESSGNICHCIAARNLSDTHTPVSVHSRSLLKWT
jgi:hypothetical protein